jgi:hypothetical protein
VPVCALIPSGSLDSDACVPPEPVSFSPPLPLGTKLAFEADPDEADVVDPLDAEVAEPLDPEPPAAELELELDFELELPQAASATAAITTANADKLCTQTFLMSYPSMLCCEFDEVTPRRRNCHVPSHA